VRLVRLLPILTRRSGNGHRRHVHAAHEVMKARIRAQRSELGVDVYPNHPVAVVAVGLFEPRERLVLIA